MSPLAVQHEHVLQDTQQTRCAQFQTYLLHELALHGLCARFPELDRSAQWSLERVAIVVVVLANEDRAVGQPPHDGHGDDSDPFVHGTIVTRVRTCIRAPSVRGL